jgi:hypothetical protein
MADRTVDITDPRFAFHLKHGVVADLPAEAEVITDPDERYLGCGSAVLSHSLECQNLE